MKIIICILLVFLCTKFFSQNTIKVRKSDTTFNAFYYSKEKSSNTYSNIFQGGAKGRVVFSKKSRSYYILREDGSIFFFNEKPNFKKIKKRCDKVDWTILNNTNGKYYISGSDILIFPYTYTETGEKVLGSQNLSGTIDKSKITMRSKSAEIVMLKLK